MKYYKSRLFHTFFLTTMTFSAGIYKNGNRNLQLKLPVPSRDLEKNRQIMKALLDGVYQKITVVIRATNQMEANYPVEPMGSQRRYKHTA